MAYAKRLHIEGITGDMPAILIRKKLRGMGITEIAVPRRVLGQPEMRNRAAPMGDIPPDAPVQEISVEEDLERQFARQPAPVEAMTIQELRIECKRRKIKMERTDNVDSLRRKLSVQDAA